jgi:adenosine deaminase
VRVRLAELHVHLEGTVRHATALELAALHRMPAPPPYRYSTLAAFLDIYRPVAACMRTAADFARVIAEHAQAIAAERVTYSEISINPSLHPPAEGWIDGIVAGRRQALNEHGLEIGWLFELTREGPDADNQRVLELALATEGVVGIGLVGDESISSASLAPLVARAHARGLRFMPHAGQAGDARAVKAAVERLGADRLAHGVAAVSDARLLRDLARRGVCLCICPSSNHRIGLRPDFRALADAGVALTVNTDDPAFVPTTLKAELDQAETSLGLDRESLVAAAWRHRFA